MNTKLGYKHENIFQRAAAKNAHIGHKARLAEIYGKLEMSKQSGGLISSDYMQVRRRLANNKEMTNEFNT